jgi:hypothetical protein
MRGPVFSALTLRLVTRVEVPGQNRAAERRPGMARRGRPFVVAWNDEDTEEALRTAYRAT